MNLYGLFILGVNIKYIVFSILYRHINVPMACKELRVSHGGYGRVKRRAVLLEAHVCIAQLYCLSPSTQISTFTEATQLY